MNNSRAVWFIDALLPVGSNWKWEAVIGPATNREILEEEFFKDKNYRKYSDYKIRFRKGERN